MVPLPFARNQRIKIASALNFDAEFGKALFVFVQEASRPDRVREDEIEGKAPEEGDASENLPNTVLDHKNTGMTR